MTHEALWPLLLHLAWRLDTALEGLRAMGAEVVRNGDRLKMQCGSMDMAEYLKARDAYLLPHKDALVALLQEAALWKQVDEPSWADKPLAGIRRTWFTNGERTISISENEATP
jgi:hypothetical protein